MKSRDTEAGDKPATGKVHMLPTAATSYLTVHRAGKNWAVVLVTPCPGQNLRTRLRIYTDRTAAIEDGKATAARMLRPFKARGAA